MERAVFVSTFFARKIDRFIRLFFVIGLQITTNIDVLISSFERKSNSCTTYDCCDLRRLIIFCIDLLFLRTYKYTYLLFARLVVLLPFYREAFTFKRLALSGESAKLGDPFKAFHFLANELSNKVSRDKRWLGSSED